MGVMKPWEPPLDDDIADEVLDRIGREMGAVPPLDMMSEERAREVLEGLRAGRLKASDRYVAALERMLSEGVTK